MALLLTMLPVYLLGNLHCLGMCGPLVAMLGAHRYRYFYFLGRMVSFTLAGMAAGEAGTILTLYLQKYHISALVSFSFGTVILLIGIGALLGWSSASQRFALWLKPFQSYFSLLILRDGRLPTFLFGFLTIALPCGQTIMVYAACALSANIWTGTFNGFAFALLTSPSLFLALQSHSILQRSKQYYNILLGGCAIVIGALAWCRGLAEMEVINHWVINHNYHIVMF